MTSDLVNQQGSYTMDFDDLEAKVKDEKVSLCIFCNPHNPSGRVWTAEELKRFGDIFLKNKGTDRMKKVGIIGGTGPESTVDYYQSIISKFQEKIGSKEDLPELPMLIKNEDLNIHSLNTAEIHINKIVDTIFMDKTH